MYTKNLIVVVALFFTINQFSYADFMPPQAVKCVESPEDSIFVYKYLVNYQPGELKNGVQSQGTCDVAAKLRSEYGSKVGFDGMFSVHAETTTEYSCQVENDNSLTIIRTLTYDNHGIDAYEKTLVQTTGCYLSNLK